jgi:tetratricopeptide (TPR) repeat protein
MLFDTGQSLEGLVLISYDKQYSLEAEGHIHHGGSTAPVKGEAMGREVVLTEEMIEAIQARSRRWLLVRVILVVAALAAGVWWLWYRPLPAIYVAVVQPEVDESLPAGIRGSLRMSLSADLSLLRDVYPLRSDEVDAGGKDLRELADAVGAEEIVTSRVTDNGDSCRVEITRTWTDTRHQSSQSFDVTPVSAVAISSAVSQRIREIYRERRNPLRRSQDADYAAYSEIWIRQDEQGYDSEQVLREMSELRKKGNAPIEVYWGEVSLARYLYETTNDDQYLERARNVLSQAPNHPGIALLGAELALATGDTNEAQKLLDSVPEEHPDFWWYQSWIHQTKSEWESASAVIYMAMLRRESWRHNYFLGRIWRKAGQIERARRCYDKALKMVPKSLQVAEELAYLEFESGDLERSKQLYLDLMRRSKVYQARYGLNLATANLLLGRYEDAALSLRHELSLGHESADILLSLADAYHFLGDQKADETYQKVVDATELNDRPKPIAYRAQAMACLGRHADAAAAVDHALSKERSSHLLYTAAIVFTVTGDSEKAAALAREAIDKGKSQRWFELPWFDGLEIGK